MKQLDIKTESKIELSVKQQKEIKHQLIDRIIPHKGHTIWQIHNETKQVEKAKFSSVTYNFLGENKKEIIIKKGYSYVSALNKENALKQFNKGQNGSKKINQEPLPY